MTTKYPIGHRYTTAGRTIRRYEVTTDSNTPAVTIYRTKEGAYYVNGQHFPTLALALAEARIIRVWNWPDKPATFLYEGNAINGGPDDRLNLEVPPDKRRFTGPFTFTDHTGAVKVGDHRPARKVK